MEVFPLCYWLGFPHSIYLFASQGLREIWIGTQLQEVGMRHCWSGWGKMSVVLTGSDTEYLMDMLEGMFGAPVYSETKDEPIRSQTTKKAASEPAAHPGPSKCPKCSKEVEYILQASLSRPISALEGWLTSQREWRGSPYISAAFWPVASLHRIGQPPLTILGRSTWTRNYDVCSVNTLASLWKH